jgi:hypothetical protein
MLKLQINISVYFFNHILIKEEIINISYKIIINI